MSFTKTQTIYYLCISFLILKVPLNINFSLSLILFLVFPQRLISRLLSMYQNLKWSNKFIIKLRPNLIFSGEREITSFWGCSKIKFDNKLSMNVHLMYNFYMLFIDYLIYLYASILIRYGIQLHAIPKYIETKSETANT